MSVSIPVFSLFFQGTHTHGPRLTRGIVVSRSLSFTVQLDSLCTRIANLVSTYTILVSYHS